MGLNPVTGGLRPIWNNSKQTAKVQLHIAPGDALVVSDDVAAQLQAADTHFVDGEPTWTLDELKAANAPAPAPAEGEAEAAPADDADAKPKRGRARKPTSED